MESSNKRVRLAPPRSHLQDDFIPLATNDDGMSTAPNGDLPKRISSGGHGRHSHPNHTNQARNDRHVNSGHSSHRQAADRPKSKHALPGCQPWILVKTKLHRRFVHNTETKQSFWRIPPDVRQGVLDFERWEHDQGEKAANTRWAEEQLAQMRSQRDASNVNRIADGQGSERRRRSESLQREDEEALMVELSVQAEHDEATDVKETVKAVEPLQPRREPASYDTDSSYEEVEVTDSEFEDDDHQTNPTVGANQVSDAVEESARDEPVEFGEDDIAYQLAAMGDQHGSDPEGYGDGPDDWEAEGQDPTLSEDDAISLFRDLLDDFRVSPFTPWDKVIADESESSILYDDRYMALRSMRARKDAWDSWARDKAAEIKQSRENMEKQDPKIPYLEFLQDKATPKLYWPEFKRKFKREAQMNERKFSDRDREKLYRDHITRLKLPESSRKSDLLNLLQQIPLKLLNRSTSLDSLPQSLLSHLHFVSLPRPIRDPIIGSFIKSLPPAPEDDGVTAEQLLEEDRKRDERRRREKALAERGQKVEEDRRRSEKDLARARREALDAYEGE